MKKNMNKKQSDFIWKFKWLFICIPILIVLIIAGVIGFNVYQNYMKTYGNIVDEFTATDDEINLTQSDVVFSKNNKLSYVLGDEIDYKLNDEFCDINITNIDFVDADDNDILSNLNLDGSYLVIQYDVTSNKKDHTGYIGGMAAINNNKTLDMDAYVYDNDGWKNVNSDTVWKQNKTYDAVSFVNIDNIDDLNIYFNNSEFAITVLSIEGDIGEI